MIDGQSATPSSRCLTGRSVWPDEQPDSNRQQQRRGNSSDNPYMRPMARLLPLDR